MVATRAKLAAEAAMGGSLAPQSRSMEVNRVFSHAAKASELLEDLKPRIAVLDGGDDGLRLAQAALANLDAGIADMRSSVSYGKLGDGPLTENTLGTAMASGYFSAAQKGVDGLVDIARLESMSVDDVTAAVARLQA